MKYEWKINTGGFEENGNPFEISIKGNENNDLLLVTTGIKTLIETIDVKHMCNEDYDSYSNALKQILIAVVDNLICEGWEPESDFDQIENIPDVEKVAILNHFFDMFKKVKY